MTPEEEAYAEARRCIREANETGALDLDFSQLALNRLPRALGRLHIVQNARCEGRECTRPSGHFLDRHKYYARVDRALLKGTRDLIKLIFAYMFIVGMYASCYAGYPAFHHVYEPA